MFIIHGIFENISAYYKQKTNNYKLKKTYEKIFIEHRCMHYSNNDVWSEK